MGERGGGGGGGGAPGIRNDVVVGGERGRGPAVEGEYAAEAVGRLVTVAFTARADAVAESVGAVQNRSVVLQFKVLPRIVVGAFVGAAAGERARDADLGQQVADLTAVVARVLEARFVDDSWSGDRGFGEHQVLIVAGGIVRALRVGRGQAVAC